MNPFMYEEIEDCSYALTTFTDEELDLIADDILLLSREYADQDLISVLLGDE